MVFTKTQQALIDHATKFGLLGVDRADGKRRQAALAVLLRAGVLKPHGFYFVLTDHYKRTAGQ